MARDIQEIVEQQIARWQLMQRSSVPVAGSSAQPNIVTCASAVGSWGEVIMGRVGALLRVPVYDREIVDHIAHDSHVQVQTVEALDERAQGAVEDYIGALFREHNFDQDDYLRGLTRTLVALWTHGPCVLVGHGSAQIVPRSHALAVRITAHQPIRVHRIADRFSLSEVEARARLEKIDQERARFHRRLFRADVDDRSAYDVVLDTNKLDVEGSAIAVVELFRRKFNGHWYSEPKAGAPPVSG